MNEITADAVHAGHFASKVIAFLCFVLNVRMLIFHKLMKPMGKLAPLTILAVARLHILAAKFCLLLRTGVRRNIMFSNRAQKHLVGVWERLQDCTVVLRSSMND